MASDTDRGERAIYLDHAATTTPRPVAVEAMVNVYETSHGNASGHHGSARRAKNALEEARERAADLIGASRPHDIVFTSGGTESDNLAIVGAAWGSERRSLVISSIEHKAVIESARTLARSEMVTRPVPVSREGVVSPGDVAALVDSDTAVVSVMAANNETGVIQPIRRIVEAVREVDGAVTIHTDAVQLFVGAGLDVSRMGVDLASLSAHKFGGPTGVGLLYVAPGTRIDPVLVGGSQEAGRRPGTINVAGIVGMVAAMEESAGERDRFVSVVGAERDAFEATAISGDPRIVPTVPSGGRLPHFSHLQIRGVLAETLLIRLDAAGVYAAAGSACQSGAVEPSHVLTAMGLSDHDAAECVRFTFGWDTEPGDGQRAARRLLEIVGGLR